MSKKNAPALKISLASIGGRGTNILSRLASIEAKNCSRVAIGNKNALRYAQDIKHTIEVPHNAFLEKEKNAHLFDVDTLGEVSKDVKTKLEGSDIIFLIGNITNPTNVAQARQIAKMFHNSDSLFFYVSATPFPFEGKAKQQDALKGREILVSEVDGMLVVESEKVLSKGGSAIDAMTQVDTVIANMIDTVTELLHSFGVVNVDFADLLTTVKHAGNLYFNSVQASKNELEDIAEKVFVESYLDTSMQGIKRALYVVYAGKNVLLEEINTIGEKIKARLDDQSQIIFGLVEDKKLKDEIRVTFVGG